MSFVVIFRKDDVVCHLYVSGGFHLRSGAGLRSRSV